MKMTLNLREHKETSILKLEHDNKFYVLNHTQVFEAVTQLLENKPSVVKIDFNAIQYIDSSAFNTIIKLHKYSKELDKKLIMLNVKGVAYKLFDMLRLTEVLNFELSDGFEVEKSENVLS